MFVMAKTSPDFESINLYIHRVIFDPERHFMRHYFLTLCCTIAALAVAPAGLSAGTAPTETPVLATLPTGAEYTDGPHPNTKIITQTDNTVLRNVIDWQSFNIGADAEVVFKSANKSLVTVNRVVGGGTDPSRIYGKLTADGIVVILDPNGVFFSSTAVIDVGGIVASTGQLANQTAFENGAPMQLTDMGAVTGAMVKNKATRFTVKDAGLAAFVAPAVQNKGIITARLGHVVLASGATATLDFYGDRMFNIAVTEGIAAALPQGRTQIDNKGKIIANGGTVQMTARAASSAIDTVINSDGLVVATHAEDRDGTIILSDGKTPDRELKNAVRVGHTATIQDGINAAMENATIYINGGNYSENIHITKPLTLTSFDEEPAALFGDAAAAVISVYAPNVKIDGLRLLEGLYGIAAEHADGLHVANSVINLSRSHGIYLRDTATAHDFENGAGNIFSPGIGGKNVFVDGIGTADTPDNTRIFNTPAFGGFAAAPLVIEQSGMNATSLAALAPAAGGDDGNHCADVSSCTDTGASGGN